MKQIVILLFLFVPVICIAQESLTQDTVLYVGNRKYVVKETDDNIKVRIYEQVSQGDTIENDQVFEGVYKNGKSTERRISLSIPFLKKKYSKDKKSYHFDEHVAGLYAGYSQLADGINFSTSDHVDLVASKSWEWGLNLFESALNLTHNWGLTSGLGFGYNSFRLDGNYGFEERNGITNIYPAPDDINYKRSRLRYYHLRLPLSLEWQKRINYKGPLFFSLGAEIEMRFWVKSKAVIDKNKHTLSKDLNVRPLGINVLAQAGYNNWGFYCRYSTASLFEKNKGPELYPFSVGIKWFW